MFPGITQQISIGFNLVPKSAVLQMLFAQLSFFTLVFSDLINSKQSWCAGRAEGGDEEAAGRGVGEDVVNFYITHYTQEESKATFFLFFTLNKLLVYYFF